VIRVMRSVTVDYTKITFWQCKNVQKFGKWCWLAGYSYILS
jgi:hypothetical protein